MWLYFMRFILSPHLPTRVIILWYLYLAVVHNISHSVRLLYSFLQNHCSCCYPNIILRTTGEMGTISKSKSKKYLSLKLKIFMQQSLSYPVIFCQVAECRSEWLDRRWKTCVRPVPEFALCVLKSRVQSG